ncbi:MAG: polymorphic toxin type 28 domain-containing protein [Chloroflexota bacterium]
MREDAPKQHDYRTKTNRIKECLTTADLLAAHLELFGQVVARKRSGVPYDHVAEIRNAQQGLLNRIEQIKNRLDYQGTPDEDRPALAEELGEASRLLDYSEWFVPR